ncbi:hypothetical protein FA09DRAFT_49255 [Tilletiopsis washingtonensis]|uniref:Uncharacterized protein n=1 Tax=Tilletiopsis washingtonensis TaxID=58919 RepID=A0A316Z6W2_9BASI|nr:hypothetical protein FA09DRAFT_49255 [Tilletiopsis washingtonensis]PWN97301.1 hypothetical protein FA09DRAFT_49255 [Tilletiopsis washingtonensis]
MKRGAANQIHKDAPSDDEGDEGAGNESSSGSGLTPSAAPAAAAPATTPSFSFAQPAASPAFVILWLAVSPADGIVIRGERQWRGQQQHQLLHALRRCHGSSHVLRQQQQQQHLYAFRQQLRCAILLCCGTKERACSVLLLLGLALLRRAFRLFLHSRARRCHIRAIQRRDALVPRPAARAQPLVAERHRARSGRRCLRRLAASALALCRASAARREGEGELACFRSEAGGYVCRYRFTSSFASSRSRSLYFAAQQQHCRQAQQQQQRPSEARRLLAAKGGQHAVPLRRRPCADSHEQQWRQCRGRKARIAAGPADVHAAQRRLQLCGQACARHCCVNLGRQQWCSLRLCSGTGGGREGRRSSGGEERDEGTDADAGLLLWLFLVPHNRCCISYEHREQACAGRSNDAGLCLWLLGCLWRRCFGFFDASCTLQARVLLRHSHVRTRRQLRLLLRQRQLRQRRSAEPAGRGHAALRLWLVRRRLYAAGQWRCQRHGLHLWCLVDAAEEAG